MMLKGDSILQQLTQHPEKTGSPVLSLYLNVDQADPRNLKRGYEVSLRNLLRGIEQALASKADKDDFREDAAAVMAFIAEYRPQGKCIALFCDASEKFLWHRNLCVPVMETARWDPRPHLRPLIEARDEFGRCAIVLTDRAHARLFIVFMGEIEETIELLAQTNVKRFAGPAKDQEWKQDILQRKADEHARQHLKNVAETMARLADTKRCDRLILAGPPEATADSRGPCRIG